jgi:HEAT repeat protein
MIKLQVGERAPHIRPAQDRRWLAFKECELAFDNGNGAFYIKLIKISDYWISDSAKIFYKKAADFIAARERKDLNRTYTKRTKRAVGRYNRDLFIAFRDSIKDLKTVSRETSISKEPNKFSLKTMNSNYLYFEDLAWELVGMDPDHVQQSITSMFNDPDLRYWKIHLSILNRQLARPQHYLAHIDINNPKTFERVNLDTLKRLLLHDSEDIRTNAVIALGKKNNEEAVDTLINLIEDEREDHALRATAVTALINTGGRRAIKTLLNRLNDPSSKVRIASTRAMGQAGDKSVAPELVRYLLRETNINGQVAAAETLKKLGDKSSTPILRERLKHAEPSSRISAIRILGIFGDKDTTGAITERLWDAEMNVRIIAAFALRDIGDKKAVPELIRLLNELNTNQHYLLQTTLFVLGELGDETAIPALVDYLLNEPNIGGQVAAAEALRKLGDKSAAPFLRQRLKHKNPSRREGAVRALGILDDKSATSAIVECLQDESLDVRIAAIGTLRRMGDKSTLPKLIEIFNDTNTNNPRLLREIATALGEFHDKRAKSALEKFHKSDDPRTQNRDIVEAVLLALNNIKQ